jgi:hypothetical protein
LKPNFTITRSELKTVPKIVFCGDIFLTISFKDCISNIYIALSNSKKHRTSFHSPHAHTDIIGVKAQAHRLYKELVFSNLRHTAIDSHSLHAVEILDMLDQF